MTADVRLEHEIERLRACVEALVLNIAQSGPSLEAARALADCAVRIVALVAVKDAREHAAHTAACLADKPE